MFLLANYPVASRVATMKKTICCGICGQGSMLNSAIDLDSTVKELERSLAPRLGDELPLELYVARCAEGNWMAADRRTQRLLIELRQPTFENMNPHRLLKWYFGYAFEPHEDDLHLVIEISPAYRVSEDKMDHQEGQSYREIAEVLKDTKEVRALEDAVFSVIARNMRGPIGSFIVLENSSGMGKTQMAFNLMTCGSVEVFYVVCGLSGELASKKPLCFMVHSRPGAFK